jgi:hypothetical protein
MTPKTRAKLEARLAELEAKIKRSTDKGVNATLVQLRWWGEHIQILKRLKSEDELCEENNHPQQYAARLP